MGADLTLSIVSHGHGADLRRLLEDLCRPPHRFIGHVVVTHNTPDQPLEPPAGGWPFPLTQLHNPAPRGFGQNHNRAFALCATPFFCVLNPDLRIDGEQVWGALVDTLAAPGCALAYPVLLNPDGSTQDNQRAAVTPAALLRRHLLRRADTVVDWVSAAFWVVRSPVYRALGGFDERYFMYCEDTDFCLRLRLAGWRLGQARCAVTHQASRRSRSDWQHLRWHLRSLWRLWTGPVLRPYLAQQRRQPA